MLHSVFGKSAVAVPQLFGSGELQTLLGTTSLANCHMRIPADRSSKARTPPPLLLNVSPKVVSVPALTPQPALASVVLTQDDPITLPVSFRLTPFIVQPLDVWSVIWLNELSTTFTASMTSISPFSGQFEGSVSQRAGQVPHPIGECLTSKTKRVLRPYCFLEVTRTEKRPVDALGTDELETDVSTRRIADVAVV